MGLHRYLERTARVVYFIVVTAFLVAAAIGPATAQVPSTIDLLVSSGTPSVSFTRDGWGAGHNPSLSLYIADGTDLFSFHAPIFGNDNESVFAFYTTGLEGQSGMQTFLKLQPVGAQGGSAGWTIFGMNVLDWWDTSTGPKYLVDWKVKGVSKFRVGADGVVTLPALVPGYACINASHELVSQQAPCGQ